MNNEVKEKLQVKDLILIGVMAILLFACMFVVVMILGMNLLTYLFAPAIAGIPAGIVMMLLLSKAPKTGTFFLASAVIAVFFLIMGRLPLDVVTMLVCGVIGEVLYGALGRKRFRGMAAAHAVYTCGLTLVAFISVVLLKDAWAKAFAGYGRSYIAKVIEWVTPMSLVGLCLLSALCGLIGAWLGKCLLKKHFEKAGVL
jgi:energy-coupling factor transport system substrate-specific component